MIRPNSRALRTCGVSLIILVAACGGGPGNTPTPVANAPQIACPADISVRGIIGGSQTVSYAAPTVTGGSAPVNTSCTHPSGAPFPLGTTTVNCTANDALARQATCSFKVAVTGLTLGVTKFETVGDSLTEGENGLPAVAFVDPPNSYPTKLRTLLETTYPGQGITLVNRGVGGQRIERTLELLPRELAEDRPQAVLLLGGYNNLTNPCQPGKFNTPACQRAITEVEFGIRDCIREAKESPVGIKYIFVSTLTPAGAVAANSPKDLRIASDATLEVNKRIRLRVAQEGATLVDTFPLFIGREADYISIDGLHLKPAGYQAIADAFFAAVRATIPQTSLFGLTVPR